MTIVEFIYQCFVRWFMNCMAFNSPNQLHIFYFNQNIIFSIIESIFINTYHTILMCAYISMHGLSLHTTFILIIFKSYTNCKLH